MTDEPPGRSTMIVLLLFRYVIPGALVSAGFAFLIFKPGEDGRDGFALFVGAGLSVLLLNVLYRVGVSGDAERQAEDRAREYFHEHGRWPDE